MIRFAFSIFVALLLSSTIRADDWPQWLGPKRDGVWRETGILAKFPKDGPKVLWRTPISEGYSGPSVANGKVYITDYVRGKKATKPKGPMDKVTRVAGVERVFCLNEADGSVFWKHEYEFEFLHLVFQPLDFDFVLELLNLVLLIAVMIGVAHRVSWYRDDRREHRCDNRRDDRRGMVGLIVLLHHTLLDDTARRIELADANQQYRENANGDTENLFHCLGSCLDFRVAIA